MAIRQATAADVDAIARVHVLAWQETYRGILPGDFLTSLSTERRREMWSRQLADPVLAPGIIVLTSDGDEVAGFAASGPARDKTLPFDGEIYAIYLLSSHQKRGLGRALFHAAAKALHGVGCHSMMLWVLKENPTRGFYEHLGGKQVREQRIAIGSAEYLEVAYGWDDLSRFLHPPAGQPDGADPASPEPRVSCDTGPAARLEAV